MPSYISYLAMSSYSINALIHAFIAEIYSFLLNSPNRLLFRAHSVIVVTIIASHIWSTPDILILRKGKLE